MLCDTTGFRRGAVFVSDAISKGPARDVQLSTRERL